MKKILFLITVCAGVHTVCASTASSSTEPKTQTYVKWFKRKPGEHWTYPLTHRERLFFAYESVPKGYTITNPNSYIRQGIKEKTSGEHEYWNQFIGGYIPEEDFERTMHMRKLYGFKRSEKPGDIMPQNVDTRSLLSRKYITPSWWDQAYNYVKSWWQQEPQQPTRILNVELNPYYGLHTPHIRITKEIDQAKVQE